MADSKITDLTELTDAADGDWFPIVDIDAAPATTKKISFLNTFKNVLNTLLTGISFATSTAVTASDSILIAIGKLQAQITALSFSKIVFSQFTIGTTSDPTTTASTSGTAPVLAEMTHTFTPSSASNKIDVFFSGTFGESVSGKDATISVGVFVDGTLQGSTQRSTSVKGITITDKLDSISTQWEGTLTAASHTITIRFWIAGGGTAQAIGVNRNLIIRETKL